MSATDERYCEPGVRHTGMAIFTNGTDLFGEPCNGECKSDGYGAFLERKHVTAPACGFDAAAISAHTFDFQESITKWALRLGRAAIFASCGLGKTLMQLEWARHVTLKAKGPVLIFAPLAVSQQTHREGEKFGIAVNVCKDSDDVCDGINITNYERLDRFDLSRFAGIVLDESSILKSVDGATRTALIEQSQGIRYRLACTATPAPNDYMELGNHSAFLGLMTQQEMLSMFFVHDGGETQKWRLKGHAEDAFWRWVCSWGVMIESPSDIGFDGSTFELPPLRMHEHIVASKETPEGMLFPMEARTLNEQRGARRSSMAERVAVAAKLVNKSKEPWLLYCDLNAEGDALAAAIPDAVQVAGADSADFKTKTMLDFAEGRLRVLVSKPSICGLGMNLQVCSHVAFVGVSHSFEAFYQAIRRCWRFGQTQPVNCHIISSSTEGAVVANLKRKEADAQKMRSAMVAHMALHGLLYENRHGKEYKPIHKMEVPQWIQTTA